MITVDGSVASASGAARISRIFEEKRNHLEVKSPFLLFATFFIFFLKLLMYSFFCGKFNMKQNIAESYLHVFSLSQNDPIWNTLIRGHSSDSEISLLPGVSFDLKFFSNVTQHVSTYKVCFRKTNFSLEFFIYNFFFFFF